MGVRLYVPQTGRFLQTDPVPGGTESPYAYPSDPVNGMDLDGRKKKSARFTLYLNKRQVKRLIRHLRKQAQALRDLAEIDRSIGELGVAAALADPVALVPAAAAFAAMANRQDRARKLDDTANLLADLLEESGGLGVNIVVKLWVKNGFHASVNYYAKGSGDPECGVRGVDFDGDKFLHVPDPSNCR